MKTAPEEQASAARDRKEASKRLGIALQAKYRALLEATGEHEISLAAMDCGQLFMDNVEFIIYVLKTHGGQWVRPPERRKTHETVEKPRIVDPSDIWNMGKHALSLPKP